MLEWISDPTAWLGLLTLVVLEIVLGIDNLIFIAILADKLPARDRDRARITGLGLALFLRLGMLAGISSLATLTTPLFHVSTMDFSGRDLIFLVGGAFLLYKATMELHERLEAEDDDDNGPRVHPGFWAVIAQIVVLDAVFSIDSVVTAVGMVDHLTVMMVAVVIAILIMMAASKPLTTFVNAHPTVIVLCLGFLMMIGFSLIADGVGFHIPKGYLYAAIGFSIFIEGFNQFARAKRQKAFGKFTARERTAEAVLRLLGGRHEPAEVHHDINDIVENGDDLPVFEQAEKLMIRGVLALTERSLRSIMTPRMSVAWIDLSDEEEMIVQELRASPYSRLVVARDGKIDEPVGIVQKKDLLDHMLAGEALNIETAMLQPLYVPETMSVLEVLERFRQKAAQIALVVDEFGSFEGIVTVTDVMAAIAGDMPEEHETKETPLLIEQDGYWLVDGRTDLATLEEAFGIEEPAHSEYHTAAGMALAAFRRVPALGESAIFGDWKLTVTDMEGNRIAQFRLESAEGDTNDA